MLDAVNAHMQPKHIVLRGAWRAQNFQAPQWSEAELVTLAQLRQRGWSYGRIGKLMSRSRGSVAGRLYRENARSMAPCRCPHCTRLQQHTHRDA